MLTKLVYSIFEAVDQSFIDNEDKNQRLTVIFRALAVLSV